jgi:hypothetical protein
MSRNELLTRLKNLQDFRVDGLVGCDATLRREAASYYETTLRPILGTCNFAVAMRTPNLTNYLLTYIHTYLLTYLLTYSLHGAESFLRS